MIVVNVDICHQLTTLYMCVLGGMVFISLLFLYINEAVFIIHETQLDCR